MTYDLPETGKPPDPPALAKIAVEEHFNVLTARSPGTDEDLSSLVRTMDYDRGWLSIVGERLTDFGANRLAGMDASHISIAILSHTVPGVQGIVDAAAAVAAAREIND